MIHFRPDPTTECPVVAIGEPSDTRQIEAPGSLEALPPAMLVWDGQGHVFRFLEKARFESLEAGLTALTERFERWERDLARRDQTIDELQWRISSLAGEIERLRLDGERKE